MNRGSHGGHPAKEAGQYGFNEAPIHESGKCDPLHGNITIGIASMRPRFMNRGSHAATAPPTLVTAASMRPRFMNRGSHAVFSPSQGS